MGDAAFHAAETSVPRGQIDRFPVPGGKSRLPSWPPGGERLTRPTSDVQITVLKGQSPPPSCALRLGGAALGAVRLSPSSPSSHAAPTSTRGAGVLPPCAPPFCKVRRPLRHRSRHRHCHRVRMPGLHGLQTAGLRERAGPQRSLGWERECGVGRAFPLSQRRGSATLEWVLLTTNP